MEKTDAESRGWEIVKQVNELLNSIGSGIPSQDTSISARRLLAQYLKLNTSKPSRLHSAILSCAVKMAPLFPDFHFVPLLDLWGLQYLRPEDSEGHTSDDGKRFPSLVERMIKAYAYSLLFHPDEHLSTELELRLKSAIQQKGYIAAELDGNIRVTTIAIATRLITKEVRNRKMTFVALLMPDGKEMITEVHTITQYQRMRYDDIPNKTFRILPRHSDKGNVRIEAAYPCNVNVEEYFQTCVGYVEHIDNVHKHIHIFDNHSRHFVSLYTGNTNISVGSYVKFIPVIPQESNFKTAIITSVLNDGPEEFGYRNVTVTFANEEQGFCSWELLADADGEVHPIIETGANETQEPATKGYINKALCDHIGRPLPGKGERLQIITFLKRGKDRKKRPFVVHFK